MDFPGHERYHTHITKYCIALFCITIILCIVRRCACDGLVADEKRFQTRALRPHWQLLFWALDCRIW